MSRNGNNNQQADTAAVLPVQSGAKNATRDTERYVWNTSNHFNYSKNDQAWVLSSPKSADAAESCSRPPKSSDQANLTIVSWNVLFDLHERDDHGPSNNDANADNLERWQLIVTELGRTNADIIALQEVTPTFLELLSQATWVQEHYCMTAAAPQHAETVTPSGNVLLWRNRSDLRLVSTWTCRDAEKQRCGLAVLKWGHHVLFVANVHLLADPVQKSAAQARQRELASVIGQLQVLESRLCGSNNNKRKTGGKGTSATLISTPIILGDFNSNEQQTELQDGCFSGSAILGNRSCQGFFVDTWPLLDEQQQQRHGHGCTFDPNINPRAARTRVRASSTPDVMAPKRNDRIYIARQWQQQSDPANDISLIPVSGRLLCRGSAMPPSDHFGLSMTFQSKQPAATPAAGLGPILCSPRLLEHNAWAAAAESTTDTLLGLVLGQSIMGGIRFWDSESTLPLPHVTLLHGFVEFGSTQSRNLAVQACSNAVEQFLQQQLQHSHNDGDDGEGFQLSFAQSCLHVFTHQSAATLVALPDTQKEPWLIDLYECLIASFRQCHHQESRFESGWQPHVSLGQFGTTNAARSRLVEIRQGENWITDDCRIPVSAITLFQRYKVDGKIYAVASVPLTTKRAAASLLGGFGGAPRRPQAVPKSFLSDMGQASSRYFRGQCEALVLEIERACQHCAAVALENCGVARLVTTGSYKLHVCLPELSDLDGVVELHTTVNNSQNNNHNNNNATSRAFFQSVARHLCAVHPTAKVRTRIAGTGTATPLHILTVKLWPWAPAIDLLTCFLDTAGTPMDPGSTMAFQTIGDMNELRVAFEQQVQRGDHETAVNLFRVYQGVLRVIKLWAWKEHIYGASMGYLGGGGFAILVARVLLDGYRSGELEKTATTAATAGRQDDNYYIQLTRAASIFFFQKASKWTSMHCTLLPNSKMGSVGRRQMERAMTRGTACVLAPQSEGNHGRNTTPTTTQTMLSSIRQAAASLISSSTDTNSSLERLFENQPPASVVECVQQFHSHVVGVQIGVAKSSLSSSAAFVDRPILAEIKAWGCSHVLHILGDLERQEQHQHLQQASLRLYSSSHKSNSNATVAFTWFLGVSNQLAEKHGKTISALLDDRAQTWSDQIVMELPDLSYTFRLELVDSSKVESFLQV